jgi:hypothetical protein
LAEADAPLDEDALATILAVVALALVSGADAMALAWASLGIVAVRCFCR